VNIGAVRAAMAVKLDPIADVNVFEYAMASPTPPTIQILPPSVDYDLTMRRGFDVWTFVVQAFVDFTDDFSSQRLLDDVCSPIGTTSVKALLESDQTLGGTTATVLVTRHDFRGKVETAGGSPMLLVEFTVEVIAGGT